MNDARIGAGLRQIRLRLGRRQIDVARRARVSDSTVSLIELGRLSEVSLDSLRSVANALGARVELGLRWRGPELDRLLDDWHAQLVGARADRQRQLGWVPHVEVSYSIYGERGSVDVLSGMAAVRAVLVEEVKSDLVRADDTVRKLDEKARLVHERIAKQRFGWTPAVVGRILVLPDTDRCRRQVARHAGVLDVAFPARGPAVRRWLRDPVGPMSGILFVAVPRRTGPTKGRTGIHRVRVPSRPTRHHLAAPDRDGAGISDRDEGTEPADEP